MIFLQDKDGNDDPRVIGSLREELNKLLLNKHHITFIAMADSQNKITGIMFFLLIFNYINFLKQK